MVRPPNNKKREACQDSDPVNSQRRKKERKIEEEMGRQHHRMDRIETERGGQTFGRQRRMDRIG